MFKKLNVKKLDDIYRVTPKQLRQFGINGVDLSRMLARVYPKHQWLSWMLEGSTKKSLSNNQQKQLLEWLSKLLNIKTLDDWYMIPIQEIRRLTNLDIVSNVNALTDCLIHSYPEHKWIPWNFHGSQYKTLNIDQEKQILEWISERLFIKSLSDWYRVSLEHMRRVSGCSYLFR